MLRQDAATYIAGLRFEALQSLSHFLGFVVILLDEITL